LRIYIEIQIMSTTVKKSKDVPVSQKQKSQNTKDVNDVYNVFQQSLDKYFKEIKENAVTYLQSVSDLQQEIIEARRKNAELAIALQKDMTEKLGTNTKMPEDSLKLATNFAEQSTKAWNFQNQLMITSLETFSKNIQAFNDNSETFAEMNAKMLDSWASIIKQKSQE